MRATILTFLALHLVTIVGHASEEIPVPLASSDLSGWVHTAGGSRIQIESPEGTIKSVAISAWGKKVKIPESEMAKLKGVIYSKVSISFESGLERFGGSCVVFTLEFQDMFGGDPFKGDPMLERQVRIFVPENAPVEVLSEYINLENGKKAELHGTDQPTTAPESKSEGQEKPIPESKERSR